MEPALNEEQHAEGRLKLAIYTERQLVSRDRRPRDDVGGASFGASFPMPLEKGVRSPQGRTCSGWPPPEES
jgi:hypothetical protein